MHEKCVLLIFGTHYFESVPENVFIGRCPSCLPHAMMCVLYSSFSRSRYCVTPVTFLTPLPLLNIHLMVWFVHSALSEEEKTSLRAGLITNFNEPVNQVSGNKCDVQWKTKDSASYSKNLPDFD